MKKFVNDPTTVVADALRGVEAAHPQLRVDHENAVVYRRSGPEQGRVSLISGGGSGHEPLHAGFVGPGMLDAAVCGQVFSSPSADQVLTAVQGVDGGAGVLQLVKNYTGDVMNFEMAAELAAAEGGSEVVSVLTQDDVAVQDSSYTAGRRGVGVTMVVEKLAGAAAAQGRSLEQVADVARRASEAGRSMGLALTSATLPAVGRPLFDLPEDQIELGVGIHGEPGRSRVPHAPAADLARALLEPVLADLPFERGDRVVALTNGLGGTPLLELYLLHGEFAKLLDAAGITVERALVGSYVTSLDMAGASITLVRLEGDLLELWDAPVSTPALRWGV